VSKRLSIRCLIAGFFLVAGHSSASAWSPSLGLDLSPITRLDVFTHSMCGIPGGGSSYSRIELRKCGPCKGTFFNSWVNSREEKTFDLPPEAFEKCRKLLHETHFATMKSSNSPHAFESNTSSVEVVWYVAGLPVWHHTVDHNTPAPEPDGYKQISDFIWELEERVNPRRPQICPQINVSPDALEPVPPGQP
jgi:hypothetical protein